MMRGATAIAVLTVSMLVGSPTQAITATDLTAGREIVCRPLAPPDRLVLAFSHSMYGGEVREEYVAADGRLRRVEMTTGNAASAEYYAYTADVIREGERFRVDVPAQDFAEVVVRVDRVGAPRLLVGDRGIDLLMAAGDGHRVRLGVRSVSVIHRLTGRSC